MPDNAAILLVNPKTPYNVGAVIRACAIFDVPTLRWTGSRISTAEGRRLAGTQLKCRNKPRLPREERMKDYVGVDWREARDGDVWLEPADVIPGFAARGFIPVAVEVRDESESLEDFVHPEKALYVFGPEDGSIGGPTLAFCHRFVRIRTPHRTPLNLAAAANVVLYDRLCKRPRLTPAQYWRSRDLVSGDEEGAAALERDRSEAYG